eukprot:gene16306-biopygen6733
MVGNPLFSSVQKMYLQLCAEGDVSFGKERLPRDCARRRVARFAARLRPPPPPSTYDAFSPHIPTRDIQWHGALQVYTRGRPRGTSALHWARTAFWQDRCDAAGLCPAAPASESGVGRARLALSHRPFALRC